MSVKQLPNGRWQARWRDALGKSRSQTFRYKADADAHEDEMRSAVRKGTYVAPSAGKDTLAKWADTWLAGARDLSLGTIETYRRDLDRHILPELGELRLRDITPDLIDEYLATRTSAGVAASSVHRDYRTLHRMLEVAVERRKLIANPCAPVRPPRLPDTEMRFLTVDEVDALADAMTPNDAKHRGLVSGRYRAWVYVAAYGGLRWSELVGLERRRVDGNLITVADQLIRRADGEWHRDRPKTKAGRRVVTLPDFAAAELERHLDTFSIDGPTGLVFPNQMGNPLNGPSFRGNVWLRACGRAGLASETRSPTGRGVVYTGAPRPHDLRHTHAAFLVLAGAHPKAMQVRMGHASIKVTLDRYGHLFPHIDGELAAGLELIRKPPPEPQPPVEAEAA